MRLCEPSAFMIQSAESHPVVDLVDVPARVDDLLAVGRNLGVSNLLEVEVVIDGQKGVGPLLLRAGEAGTGEREQQRDVKGERGASHRLSWWMKWRGEYGAVA